ncbi:MAG: hypothetical protein WC415_00395 [Patescibacteria group bacterium]|jgi:hypothetical protein
MSFSGATILEGSANRTVNFFYGIREVSEVGNGLTINQFKVLAKKVLLSNHAEINVLIAKAERIFPKEMAGFDNLLYILHSVKRNSVGLSGSDYERLLNRSFRRAGAKPHLPFYN